LSAEDGAFSAERAAASPRADLLTAAVLFALGIGIVVLSFGMPRFVEQSGSGLTAPGIVPGFHGTVIAVLALLLGLRALRGGALAGAAPRAGRRSGDGGRLLLAALLGTVYAAGLVGRLPFWIASALFVFAFTACFEWAQGPAGRARRLAEAALIGIGTGLAVKLVFEELFLVRLP
jgi:putative tricarboxylic transport membrane protein